MCDNEGNIVLRTRISDGSYTEYEWDHRNRLVQVDFKPDGETVDSSTAYRYDAFNQLMARTYVNDGGLEEFMSGGGGFEMLGGGEFDDPMA